MAGRPGSQARGPTIRGRLRLDGYVDATVIRLAHVRTRMDDDFTVPEPPDVTNRTVPAGIDDHDVELEDLRRGEIETALRNGAWQEGFEEWAEYADVDEADLDVVYDAGLFAEFDFFYDPVGDTVRASPPALPTEWVEETDSSTVATVRTALDDLGEMVADRLARTYLDWAVEFEGSYVWDEETFGTVEEESPTDRG